VESLMKKAFANLTGDLAGTYYPLTGMEEKVGEGALILKGLCLEIKLAFSMYSIRLICRQSENHCYFFCIYRTSLTPINVTWIKIKCLRLKDPEPVQTSSFVLSLLDNYFCNPILESSFNLVKTV
jgi:hypothetical protein